MTKLIPAVDLVIEQNIPLPPKKHATKSAKKDAGMISVADRIRQMKRGDSLFVTPDQSVKGTALYVVQRSTTKRFATRAETRNGVEGTRIWRTK